VKGKPAIDFPAGGDFVGHIFFGRYINIHELINIIIDRWLALKGGPCKGELYMTSFSELQAIYAMMYSM